MALTRIERKRRLPDIATQETLISRLCDLGYRRHTDQLAIDDYYRRPGAAQETAEFLRMRRRDWFAEIVYTPGNTAASDATVGPKHETKVILADIEQWYAARTLLMQLGMRHVVRVENLRREYRQYLRIETGVVTVAIDTVNGVGRFLHVEVLSTDTDGADELLSRVEHQIASENLPIVTLRYRDMVMQGVLT